MGTPDHLTCLLSVLYAGQEATVSTGHETTDWFQTRKGVRKGYILSPCLFNLYTEYIMRNARLDETQAGIKKWQTLYFGAPKSLQMVTAVMKLKDTPWKESYDQPRQHIKKQRHYSANKIYLVKAMVFPVVMYGCESWTEEN